MIQTKIPGTGIPRTPPKIPIVKVAHAELRDMGLERYAKSPDIKKLDDWLRGNLPSLAQSAIDDLLALFGENKHPKANDIVYRLVGKHLEFDEAIDSWRWFCERIGKRHLPALADVTPKIIALDIDGVLNNHRQGMITGWGGVRASAIPRNPVKAIAGFDIYAMEFLRKLTRKTGATILLTSQHRIIYRTNGLKMFAHYSGLPVCGRTDNRGVRSEEVLKWLTENPIASQILIIDDEPYEIDFESIRQSRDPGMDLVPGWGSVVCTAGDGLAYPQMTAAAEFFGLDIHDFFGRQTL